MKTPPGLLLSVNYLIVILVHQGGFNPNGRLPDKIAFMRKEIFIIFIWIFNIYTLFHFTQSIYPDIHRTMILIQEHSEFYNLYVFLLFKHS